MRRPDAATLVVAGILVAGAPVVGVVLAPPFMARATGGAYHSVPSASMAPTLLPGDVVLGWPLDEDGPARGDVVVYRSGGQSYIGRVIGLAGERVQITGGVMRIDDQPAKMQRLEDRRRLLHAGARTERCVEGSVRAGPCSQQRWRETLPGGHAHVVLNIQGEIGSSTAGQGTPGDDTPIFEVPEAHVFIMGDHRDNALDSRFAARGPIPVVDVAAVITRLHYSTAPERRWAGLLQEVH
ncbi:MAG: signal peptidase I [Pseudomonadota bacterium]